MLPSVPNGAIVTYVGTWPPGTYLGFVDYTSAVFADLTAAGLVILQNSGGPALALLTGTSFSITLEIQVENGLGFASGDDLIAIIVMQSIKNPAISQFRIPCRIFRLQARRQRQRASLELPRQQRPHAAILA